MKYVNENIDKRNDIKFKNSLKKKLEEQSKNEIDTFINSSVELFKSKEQFNEKQISEANNLVDEFSTYSENIERIPLLNHYISKEISKTWYSLSNNISTIQLECKKINNGEKKTAYLLKKLQTTLTLINSLDEIILNELKQL